MSSATFAAPVSDQDLPARRNFDLAALAALFVLTLRQHMRGRRLVILSLLFLLPSALVVLLRLTALQRTLDDARQLQELQNLQTIFIFNFIPHALIRLDIE